MSAASPTHPPQVQRQITLPLSKAVEIAYKSIRQRLSRSLLVTSGIVLALAFLMSIRTTQAIEESIRMWNTQVSAERTAKAKDVADAAKQVRDAVAAANAAEVSMDKLPGDVQGHLQKLQDEKDIRPLPMSVNLLGPAMAASPDISVKLDRWADLQRAFVANPQFNRQKQLEVILESKGSETVAASKPGAKPSASAVDAGLAAQRTKTNWLLGLALMVAFVGILNAMLMSVTERFREIGTMKCLGALDSFIIKLFLIESLFQGAVGTVLGLLLGLGMSLTGGYSGYGSFAFIHFPTAEIACVALVCLAVGVALTVGGAVYPAWQAARMQPIEAMRADV